jgi:hypothetical protein
MSGCQDCEECTRSFAGKLGKAALAVSTGGLSMLSAAAAAPFKRKCPQCGHPMSDHEAAKAQIAGLVAQQAPPQAGSAVAAHAPAELPWHQRPVVVILALMFLAPLGIALVWWHKFWSQRTRVIASVASAAIFITALASSSSNKQPRAAEQATTPAERGQVAKAPDAAQSLATPPASQAPAPRAPVNDRSAVIGAWDQLIPNTRTGTPDSFASDTMRHVFRADGTVTVRMTEDKPETFKWTFAQGKFVVAYKYGQNGHPREFRLRSADEAEIVETNGYVLGTYVREGSVLAQQKTSVSIFAQVAAAKNAIDVEALVVGRSYVLSRQTLLMPDPDPADPTAALALVKNVPAGSTFSVLGKQTVSEILWYQVRTTLGGNATGWFKSTALLGQDLQLK